MRCCNCLMESTSSDPTRLSNCRAASSEMFLRSSSFSSSIAAALFDETPGFSRPLTWYSIKPIVRVNVSVTWRAPIARNRMTWPIIWKMYFHCWQVEKSYNLSNLICWGYFGLYTTVKREKNYGQIDCIIFLPNFIFVVHPSPAPTMKKK